MLTGLGDLSGAYDGRLVALGVIVCAGASMAVFNLLARAFAARGPAAATLILGLATVAAVADIWATQMIGRAAAEPGFAVSVRGAGGSALLMATMIGVAFAGVRRSGRVIAALPAGALIGLAIAVPHAIDIESVSILLDRPKAALSVALALSCAVSAILLFGRGETSGERVGACLLFSLGILSAHFTGMSAMSLPPGTAPVLVSDALTPSSLVWVAAAAGALVAGAGLVALVLNRQARRIDDDHSSHLARHDGLTGLPNAAAFVDGVERALGPDPIRSAALFRLDLDGFKALNDALGRSAGDAVLVELARRLTTLDARPTIAARFDGDGFAVWMTGLGSGTTAAAWGQRLAEAVNAPVKVRGRSIDPGCSIGMSVYPDHGAAYPVLLGRAELALAAAKADGGGVFRRFDADMDARARADAALGHDLAAALDDNRLRLAYRPRAEVGSGRLCGFDASLRWPDPESGALDEALVMRVAEAGGLALPIGTWMLGQACRDASSWDASLSVAVMLRPAQAYQSDCADWVRQILTDTGLDPRRLEIGISARRPPVRDEPRLLRTMRTLKALGIKIALCDFGADAALSGSLEFDTIKLDASWVKASADPAQASVSAAIARRAAAMGRALVADGVDNQREVAVLARHGCTHIQGPLVGAAGSVDLFADHPGARAAHRPAEIGAVESGGGRRARPDGASAPRTPALPPMVELSV